MEMTKTVKKLEMSRKPAQLKLSWTVNCPRTASLEAGIGDLYAAQFAAAVQFRKFNTLKRAQS